MEQFYLWKLYKPVVRLLLMSKFEILCIGGDLVPLKKIFNGLLGGSLGLVSMKILFNVTVKWFNTS